MQKVKVLFHKPEIFFTHSQWNTLFPEYVISTAYSLDDTRKEIKKTQQDIIVIQEKHTHPLIFETCFNNHTKVIIYTNEKKQSNSLIYLQSPFEKNAFLLKVQELFTTNQETSIYAQNHTL